MAQFFVDPQNIKQSDWLAEASETLEDIIAEERTHKYQKKFENLERKEQVFNLVDELHEGYLGDEEFNIAFLEELIKYTYSVFGDTTRENFLGAEKVTPYTMSHFHTPALLASKLGFDFSTIKFVYIHDILEEILDTICESDYGTNMQELIDLGKRDLPKLIKNLHTNFPRFEERNKAVIAQEYHDEYWDLRGAVLQLMVSDFRKMRAQGISIPAYEYFADVIGLNVITRMPGEPYGHTIKRIEDRDNYRSPLLFNDIKLPQNLTLTQYLDRIRISTMEAKLFDNLHNLKTQEEIPEIFTNGSPDKLDKWMKSLMKRLYTVDYAKELVLRKSKSGKADSSYENLYRIQLLLAQESAQEAKKIYDAIYQTWEGKKVVDKGKVLVVEFGTYKDYFDQIKNAMPIYEERGLLDKLTSPVDADEEEFTREHHVHFGGTIQRIRNFTDGEIHKLYVDFENPKTVIDAFKDAYSIHVLFNRYLALNSRGEYDPELNLFQFKGI